MFILFLFYLTCQELTLHTQEKFSTYLRKKDRKAKRKEEKNGYHFKELLRGIHKKYMISNTVRHSNQINKNLE